MCCVERLKLLRGERQRKGYGILLYMRRPTGLGNCDNITAADGQASATRATDRAIDAHVYDRVRNFLCRRHNVSRRGTSRFSFGDVFGELAVPHLMRAHNGGPPWVVR